MIDIFVADISCTLRRMVEDGFLANWEKSFAYINIFFFSKPLMYMCTIMTNSQSCLQRVKSLIAIPYTGYHIYHTSHKCRPHLVAELGNQVPLHSYKPFPCTSRINSTFQPEITQLDLPDQPPTHANQASRL